MKLTYRGVAYQANSVKLPLVNDTISGKYRGATWQGKKLAESIDQPMYTLCWRGVTYNTDGSLVPVAATQGSLSGILADSAKPMAMDQHRAAILKSLEHRINVARNQGNQQLVQALEDEWKQFA